ncbi:MAG: Gfo/Idh/MocA family oxidoreductase [Bacteroidales bacterium]|nr:Gfo/Idh/MocA family oxidoreductase [Bacteroidales bacterium]
MKKYNIGIIGAGMIAEKHIQAFRKTGRAEIIWVARQDKSRLTEFTSRYNIQHGTADYHELLADPDVEAVVITSPPYLHRNMFIDSLKAGKHILLEKPAAINRKQLHEMLEARLRFPYLKVLDCSCRHARLQPKFRFIREYIRSGQLGEVYFIHHNGLFRNGRPGIEYHPGAKWFLNKQLAGGGPMIDWGVYDLSFHLGLLDDAPELKKVHHAFVASGLDKKDPGTSVYDVEEHGMALMEFDTGLRYYWERAAHANVEAPHETRIYGTKGGLKFAFCSWDSPRITFFDSENEGTGNARQFDTEVDMRSHIDDDYALAEHFIRLLDGNEEPMMPIERAAKHLEIIFKVYETAGVKLP